MSVCPRNRVKSKGEYFGVLRQVAAELSVPLRNNETKNASVMSMLLVEANKQGLKSLTIERIVENIVSLRSA
jgi:hypothetical protein